MNDTPSTPPPSPPPISTRRDAIHAGICFHDPMTGIGCGERARDQHWLTGHCAECQSVAEGK